MARTFSSRGGFPAAEVYGCCGAEVVGPRRCSKTILIYMILIAAARQKSPLLKNLPCSRTSAAVGAGHSGDLLFTPWLGWLSLIFLASHIMRFFLLQAKAGELKEYMKAHKITQAGEKEDLG